MASSSSSSSSCLLFAAIFIITLSSLPSSSFAIAGKLPFHPKDALPLLPRQLSWPILNYLNSAVDLLPTFVGAASASDSDSSSNNTLEWKGACFYENKAWVEFNNKSGTEFGGGTLHIKVSTFQVNFPIWFVLDIFILVLNNGHFLFCV